MLTDCFRNAIMRYMTELERGGCPKCGKPIKAVGVFPWDYWRCSNVKCKLSRAVQEISGTWTVISMWPIWVTLLDALCWAGATCFVGIYLKRGACKWWGARH